MFNYRTLRVQIKEGLVNDYCRIIEGRSGMLKLIRKILYRSINLLMVIFDEAK